MQAAPTVRVEFAGVAYEGGSDSAASCTARPSASGVDKSAILSRLSPRSGGTPTRSIRSWRRKGRAETAGTDYAARVTRSALEATDRQILKLLAEDGRMSYTDLGKATGLSTSAVHQRVKRLEQRGLILGYGATVNHDAIGLPLTAFISIRPIDPSQADDAPAKLKEVPEIESCWSVAGEESYILKVRIARPVDLEALLARIRSIANVATRTTIVLSTYFENRPVTGA